MSFDRNHDAEDVQQSADQPLRTVSAADQREKMTGGEETGLKRGARDWAIGELAAENADLYRRNAEQGLAIQKLQARLDRSEARFRAWADEMAVRDEARSRREEALTDRIAELEHKLADRPEATDPRGSERRLTEPDSARAEASHHERKRASPSNEFIGIGIAAGVEVITAVADPSPSNLVVGALGMVATGIPWIRKLREADSGDRPQG